MAFTDLIEAVTARDGIYHGALRTATKPEEDWWRCRHEHSTEVAASACASAAKEQITNGVKPWSVQGQPDQED